MTRLVVQVRTNSTGASASSQQHTPTNGSSLPRRISFIEENPDIVNRLGNGNGTPRNSIDTSSVSTPSQVTGPNRVHRHSRDNSTGRRKVTDTLNGEKRITRPYISGTNQIPMGKPSRTVKASEAPVAVTYPPKEQESNASVLYAYKDSRGKGSFYPTTSHHKLEHLKVIQLLPKEGVTHHREKRDTSGSRPRPQSGSDVNTASSLPISSRTNSSLHLSKPKRSLVEIRAKYKGPVENDDKGHDEASLPTRERNGQSNVDLTEDTRQRRKDSTRDDAGGRSTRSQRSSGMEDTVPVTQRVASRQSSRTSSSNRKRRAFHPLSEYDESVYDRPVEWDALSSDTKNHSSNSINTSINTRSSVTERNSSASSNRKPPRPLSRPRSQIQKRRVESNDGDHHINNDRYDFQYTREPSSVTSYTSSVVGGVSALYRARGDMNKGETREHQNKPTQSHSNFTGQKRGGGSDFSEISSDTLGHSSKQNRMTKTNEGIPQAPQKDIHTDPNLTPPTLIAPLNLSNLSEALSATESQPICRPSRQDPNPSHRSSLPTSVTNSNLSRHVPYQATDNNTSVTSTVIQKRLYDMQNGHSNTYRPQHYEESGNSDEGHSRKRDDNGINHWCGIGHCAFDRRVIVERIALEAEVRRLQGELQHVSRITGNTATRNTNSNLTTDYVSGYCNENNNPKISKSENISSSHNYIPDHPSMSLHEQVIVQQERHIRALESRLLQMGSLLQDSNICRVSRSNECISGTQGLSGVTDRIMSPPSDPNNTSEFYISQYRDEHKPCMEGLPIAAGDGYNNNTAPIHTSTDNILSDMRRSIALLEKELEKASMERDTLTTLLSNTEQRVGNNGLNGDSCHRNEVASKAELGIQNYGESYPNQTDERDTIHVSVRSPRRNTNISVQVPAPSPSSLLTRTGHTPRERGTHSGHKVHHSAHVSPNLNSVRDRHSCRNNVSIHTPEQQRRAHDTLHTPSNTPLLNIVVSADNTLNGTEDINNSAIIGEKDNYTINNNMNNSEDIVISPFTPSEWGHKSSGNRVSKYLPVDESSSVLSHDVTAADTIISHKPSTIPTSADTSVYRGQQSYVDGNQSEKTNQLSLNRSMNSENPTNGTLGNTESSSFTVSYSSVGRTLHPPSTTTGAHTLCVNVSCSPTAMSGLNISRETPHDQQGNAPTPAPSSTPSLSHTCVSHSAGSKVPPSVSQQSLQGSGDGVCDAAILDGCHEYLDQLKEELHSTRDVSNELCQKIESKERTILSAAESIGRSYGGYNNIFTSKSIGDRSEASTPSTRSSISGGRRMIHIHNNDNIFYNKFIPSNIDERLVSVSASTEDVRLSPSNLPFDGEQYREKSDDDTDRSIISKRKSSTLGTGGAACITPTPLSVDPLYCSGVARDTSAAASNKAMLAAYLSSSTSSRTKSTCSELEGFSV